jgi:hypothetical protein
MNILDELQFEVIELLSVEIIIDAMLDSVDCLTAFANPQTRTSSVDIHIIVNNEDVVELEIV